MKVYFMQTAQAPREIFQHIAQQIEEGIANICLIPDLLEMLHQQEQAEQIKSFPTQEDEKKDDLLKTYLTIYTDLKRRLHVAEQGRFRWYERDTYVLSDISKIYTSNKNHITNLQHQIKKAQYDYHRRKSYFHHSGRTESPPRRQRKVYLQRLPTRC